MVVLDVVLKRQFGARGHADGDIGFSDSGKATGNCFRKIRNYQLVANFCSPRRHTVKTIVTLSDLPYWKSFSGSRILTLSVSWGITQVRIKVLLRDGAGDFFE